MKLRESLRRMVTGVGLITTYTKELGANVMAAEWTMTVSHNPPLILVAVHKEDATNEMIEASGEFGVSVAAEDQSDIVSLAGSFSRHETDKMSSSLVKTYPAKKIRAPMIEGAAVNAECVVRQKVQFGDYTGFVGEVVEISHNEQKRPLVYHMGRTWKMQDLEKPPALYVAATYAPDRKQIVAEGRLRGVPGPIDLNLVNNGTPSRTDSTTADVRGFYEHAWAVDGPDGAYGVQAKIGNLIATAKVARTA